jgi:transcriptional regulator with XRE-family HTH domain
MEIYDIRQQLHMSQKDFCEYFHIPLPTLRHWEQKQAKPPAYLVMLLEKELHAITDNSVEFQDLNGNIYFYNELNHSIKDTKGNTIIVQFDLKKIKESNLKIYLTDLFEDTNHAIYMFDLECDEDQRSDIIWERR